MANRARANHKYAYCYSNNSYTGGLFLPEA
jgi:hypothetical protein